MQANVLSKNLVKRNIIFGTERTKAFKNMIQEVLYPNNPEYFSPGAMAAGLRAIEALKKSGGRIDEIVDLMLFYVECGSQFTCDYGDIDEDFYTELETVFEDVLKLIKEHDLLDSCRSRLIVLLNAVDGMGWGYGDQISDLCDMYIGDSQWKNQR